MNMPPGMLIMLLELHVFPYRDQCGSLNGSPAEQNWLARLLAAELIEIDSRRRPLSEMCRPTGYHTTERGKVYIDKLGNLPLPVRTWT